MIFWVGQRIKCIRETNNKGLTRERIYTVIEKPTSSEAETDDYSVWVLDDRDLPGRWFCDRFVLIKGFGHWYREHKSV